MSGRGAWHPAGQRGTHRLVDHQLDGRPLLHPVTVVISDAAAHFQVDVVHPEVVPPHDPGRDLLAHHGRVGVEVHPRDCAGDGGGPHGGRGMDGGGRGIPMQDDGIARHAPRRGGADSRRAALTNDGAGPVCRGKWKSCTKKAPRRVIFFLLLSARVSPFW